MFMPGKRNLFVAIMMSVVLCVFLSLGGCIGMREGAKKGDLSFAVNDYIQSLRWGLLARALTYVPDDQQEHFIKTAEDVFEKVSFADFEVRAILPDQEITTAKVMVTVSIYTKNSLKLETVKQVQHWKRIEKRWYIMDPDLEIFLQKLNLE